MSGLVLSRQVGRCKLWTGTCLFLVVSLPQNNNFVLHCAETLYRPTPPRPASPRLAPPFTTESTCSASNHSTISLHARGLGGDSGHSRQRPSHRSFSGRLAKLFGSAALGFSAQSSSASATGTAGRILRCLVVDDSPTARKV